MRDLGREPGLLSLNTATVRKQAPLDRIIDAAAARGFGFIDPWRDQVHAVGLEAVARQIRDAGIKLSGYCRGGFYTAEDAAGLMAALDDNKRAIDEAKTLDSPCLVLVVGALPGALSGPPKNTDIGLARTQVRDGIAASLEYAKRAGMPLAIEPLHPMQAAERACVNTLEHALDLCDELDPGRTGALGVALDAYHVWWDPKLAGQIARAARTGCSPITSATGWCRRATCSTIAACRVTALSNSASCAAWSKRRGSRVQWNWNSSRRRGGRGRSTRRSISRWTDCRRRHDQ